MVRVVHCHPTVAFSSSVPIARLGGLIGLSGAEFRRPVLAGPLGYATRQVVPLNLMIAIVAITAALAIRSQSHEPGPIADLGTAIVSLIAGVVLASILGAMLFSRVSNERQERLIPGLPLLVGVGLIAESFSATKSGWLLPEGITVDIVAGVLFGIGVGPASSLLGATDTASLLVGLPTIAVGIIRYARRTAYPRQALRVTVLPMAIGLVAGAVIGSLLAGIVPAGVLIFGLGVILIGSAIRVFAHARRT